MERFRIRLLAALAFWLAASLAPRVGFAQDAEAPTEPSAEEEGATDPDGEAPSDGEDPDDPEDGTSDGADGGGAGVIAPDEGDEAIPLADPSMEEEPLPEPAAAPVEAQGRVSAEEDESAAPAPEASVIETVPAARVYANDPCRPNLRGRFAGPLSVSTHDGNLGLAHRACARQEMALGGDVLLIADNDDLYGNIRVNARGRISAPILDPGIEGFVSWELFRYHTLISAVSSSYIGLGYLSFGARGQVFRDDGIVLAMGGRLVAPTTSGLDVAAQPLALDLGFTGAFQVDTAVRFHVALNLLGSLSIGSGPADPAGGLRLLAGVDLVAAEWISFVIEAAAGFGYLDALDSVEARGGFRMAFSDEVGLELALSFPFVGARAFDDGALPIAASLMLGWNMP